MKKLLLTLILFSSSLMAQEESAEPASIVEIARQARAQRALVSNPPIVITNANLKTFRALLSRPPVPAWKKTEIVPGTSIPEGWGSLFERARGHLESILERSRSLQEKMAALSNGWVPVVDGQIEGTIQAQLQETDRALEQNQQELEAARQLLDDLQKEARRAGLPAGVIRKMAGRTP